MHGKKWQHFTYYTLYITPISIAFASTEALAIHIIIAVWIRFIKQYKICINTLFLYILIDSPSSPNKFTFPTGLSPVGGGPVPSLD